MSGTAADVSPGYDEIAAFFDGFAEVDATWRRRNRGYFEQLECVYGFLVPPGASVLEIGCGSGDLLASLRPSDGLGVDVSGEMVELARSRHPGLEFEQASGELALRRQDVRLHRPLRPRALRPRPRGPLREPPAPLARAHARRRQLPQPALAAGHRPGRAPAAEGAQAAPQLGLARRHPQRPRARPLRARDAHPADPPAQARPAAHDLPQRLRRQHLAVQPPLPDVLDRRAPAGGAGGGAERLGRLPVPERGGQHRRRRRAAARDGLGHRADLRRGRLDGRHPGGDRAADRRAPGEEQSRSSSRRGRARGTPSGRDSRRRGTTC